MKTRIRLVMGSLVLMVCSSAAVACSCAEFGGGAVCQDYWKAKAVFVGTVIDSKTATFTYRQRRSVRFSIDERFRGAEGAQIEVLTGFDGGDCGLRFSQGKQYLVYAYEYEEGKLFTGICNRTKGIDKAAEDLAYIRGLPKAKPGSTIRVSVIKNPSSTNVETPQPGQTVVIKGAYESKEYQTDPKGLVVVEGLSPGNYEVTLSLPDGLMTYEPTKKIEVSDRGCSYVNYRVDTDGRLSGRVLNAAGLPVVNAEIVLSEADKDRYPGYGYYAKSDDKGNYSVRRIPPGKYVLVIRYDGNRGQDNPFPLMYFPGTANKSEARVITVGEGQSIEQFDLTMPPVPAEFEIEGTVQALNGEAPRVEYQISGQNRVYGTEVKEGKFRFRAYEGLRLQIRATQQLGENKRAASGSVEVTVVAGLPPLQLVIEPQPARFRSSSSAVYSGSTEPEFGVGK